jgi:hypothetical protein
MPVILLVGEIPPLLASSRNKYPVADIGKMMDNQTYCTCIARPLHNQKVTIIANHSIAIS